MAEIINMKDDIVKVLFYINIIFFLIGIFLTSKTYFIIVIIINIIFNGTFIVIKKWSNKFAANNKLFGGLNRALDNLSNMGKYNGKV
jgi:hypothetical protein